MTLIRLLLLLVAQIPFQNLMPKLKQDALTSSPSDGL
jgi:hypothetical protein